MQSIVDAGVGAPGPGIGQGVVEHAVHQAGVTALGLQHGAETLGRDELVPVVRAPGQQPRHVLGPQDGHHPAQPRPGERGQEQRAARAAHAENITSGGDVRQKMRK